jgi:hypothetical protein
MTYTSQERARAAAWKASTATLPDAARQPAPYLGQTGRPSTRDYDFCLPAAYAAWSLLPEVRERALPLFRELGIPWHAGVNGGPSNHLLSSQVQCVNALGQMVADPERLLRAFGDVAAIEEVLEIEPGRHLTFEYIGPTDFFGEAPRGVRTRGANCTSVDAAFRHLAKDGQVELVLVEWKYTESYGLRRPSPRKDAVRRGRYATFVDDPAGPIRSDVLAFDDLLDEPFYQLVRQQLLASQLEKAGAEHASRVRLIHVSPAANVAYQQSVRREQHRALGSTVSEVWKRLLRRSDRFTSLDSSRFLDPAITSVEYASRYGDVMPAAG